MKEIRGIIPALLSPFTSHDEFDDQAFTWLCRNCLEGGVHALMLGGSLGEFPSLTEAERLAEIRIAVREANSRVPVIAGASSPSTAEAIRLAKGAKEEGADAALVLPPYYYQASEEAVFNHYDSIAHAVDIPLVIYNFPGTTKVSLSPPFVARLARIDGIVGIKNSVDSLIHLREIIRLTREIKSFAVIPGMEDYLIPGLLLGARGSVSGFSNMIPRTMVRIYNDLVAGDVKKAANEFNDTVIPLKALAPPPDPISALKIGASLVGPVGTKVRLPVLDAPPGTRESMEKLMAGLNLLPTARAERLSTGAYLRS